MTSKDAPLLSISNLRVHYRSGGHDVAAVRGVDLVVGRGETVAVVGESGSGKSTTALAVLGLLDRTAHRSGAVTLSGERIDGLSDRAMRSVRGARIGLVPQDPGTALNPVHRVGDQVAEVLRIHGRANRRTARVEALEYLRDAGVDDPELRFRQLPHQLSGGQRQRVLIAISMACDPELIIADEPTSALDVTVQRRILDHLETRVRSAGASMLLITHDIGVAADRADRIVVMSDGRVVETGTAGQIIAEPRHAYTRRLIADAPGLTSDRLVRPLNATRRVVASVRGIARTFSVGGRAHVRAVSDVSLEVAAGETLALVGESGSGKTTTARIVAGLERPDTGVVRVGERHGDIAFVYQSPFDSLNPKLTVGQIIAEPMRGISKTQRVQRVSALLESVALDPEHARRRPTALSGGQRQRVAIARALATTPKLLILDEPVSALDVTVQTQILRLLADLQAEHGIAYLFISHDLAVVRQISHRVAVMKDGHIVEQGEVDDLFNRPASKYTQTLVAAIPGGRRATNPEEPANA